MVSVLDVWNSKVVDLKGLDSLTTVGFLSISDNSLLINLTGLEALDSVITLDINRNPVLSGLQPLYSLVACEGLTILGNPLVASLEGLNNLYNCKSIWLYTNDLLTDITALGNIQTLENIFVVDNNSLVNLEGFGQIDSLNVLSILDNDNLNDITAFNGLIKAHGVTINANNNLSDFNGLSQLMSVNNLYIGSNVNLIDINALSPDLVVTTNLNISGNLKLSCCIIVKYILENNPAVQVYIDNNDVGCSSEAEVRALTPTTSCCITTNSIFNKTICQGENYAVGSNVYTLTGIYYDTISIGSSCDSIITTNLTVLPTYNLIQNRTFCTGQSFTLNDGRVITSNGTYFDTLQTTSGCDSIMEYRVSFLNNITFNQNVSVCAGKSYTLPGGNSVSQTGTYRDTLISSFGCDSIVITNLTIEPYLQSLQSVSVCSGANFILPGGAIVSVAGTYSDTIQNANGCDSIVITSLSLQPYLAGEKFDTVCQGELYITPGGQQAFTSGDYLDTLQTPAGCDSILTTHLTVKPNNFLASLEPVDTIYKGQSIYLVPQYQNGIAVSWSWTPTATLSCSDCETPVAAPLQTTSYIVTVLSQDQCTDTAYTHIVVETPEIYVPGAFSPNGDGVNDLFGVFAIGVQSVKISVFNRWGQIVFETADSNKSWDGRYKDDFAPVDDYTYVVIGGLPDGTTMTKKGTILLLR